MSGRLGGYTPTKVDLTGLRLTLATMEQQRLDNDKQQQRYRQQMQDLENKIEAVRKRQEMLLQGRLALQRIWLLSVTPTLELALEKVMRRFAVWREPGCFCVASHHHDAWVRLSFHRMTAFYGPTAESQPKPEVIATEGVEIPAFMYWQIVQPDAALKPDAQRLVSLYGPLMRMGNLLGTVPKEYMIEALEGYPTHTLCYGEVFYNPETDEMSEPQALQQRSSFYSPEY